MSNIYRRIIEAVVGILPDVDETFYTKRVLPEGIEYSRWIVVSKSYVGDSEDEIKLEQFHVTLTDTNLESGTRDKTINAEQYEKLMEFSVDKDDIEDMMSQDAIEYYNGSEDLQDIYSDEDEFLNIIHNHCIELTK